MSLLSQSTVDENHVFMIKMDNAKNLLQLLKVVNFKEMATFYLNEKGIKIIVEDAKCAQATAFIQEDIFQEFEHNGEIISFRINLSILVDCLGIFSGNNAQGIVPALKMTYNGYGSPLMCLIEEGGVLTDCCIRTQEADETLDFHFDIADVINKVVMKSDCLKDIFADLDMTSDVLQITMSPDKPHFRLSTFGNFGPNYVSIPKDSEIMECFSVNETTSNRYKLSLLKPIIKLLSASVKLSLRVTSRGLVCLQFMMKTEDNHTCFVEFFCCPDEDVND